MRQSNIQKFRPKPGHIAICHAFAKPMDRQQAITASYRGERSLENRAMAGALETLARTINAFANRLEHLDPDRLCNGALQANFLLMSGDARADLSIKYETARSRGTPTVSDTPLQNCLMAPITVACAVDASRFDALCNLRRQVWALIQDISDRLTRLYFATPKMTIGELAHALREISRDARGLMVSPTPATLPLPIAA